MSVYEYRCSLCGRIVWRDNPAGDSLGGCWENWGDPRPEDYYACIGTLKRVWAGVPLRKQIRSGM